MQHYEVRPRSLGCCCFIPSAICLTLPWHLFRENFKGRTFGSTVSKTYDIAPASHLPSGHFNPTSMCPDYVLFLSWYYFRTHELFQIHCSRVFEYYISKHFYIEQKERWPPLMTVVIARVCPPLLSYYVGGTDQPCALPFFS